MNRFFHALLWLAAAVALVASGYLYGVMQHESASSPNVKRSPAKKPAASIKRKIAIRSAHRAPAKEPTAMDFLQYGQIEDALSDAMPEISWYEPGKQKEKVKMKPQTPSVSVDMHSKKPKLVIIIDDVAHPSQIDTIRALPWHITPSIFPPSELSKTSHKLASALKHYMVHLPLESGSAAMNRMQGMLFVRDSTAKVQARVDEIRRLFPKAKFINNHTGSVFTASTKAMKQLYGMLRKRDFVFVDSRTSTKSKVRKIARSYSDTYIARDIFIDNVQTRSYVLGQLKKAVRIAKKRGFAIVIGHPHKATMDALRHAGSIFEGIETVYMDELHR